MKILFNNFVLADSPDPVPLQNLRINGSSLTQEAQFFRGLARAFYDRGNAKTEVSFDTTRLFADQLSAENFLLLHATTVKGRGLLTFIAGQPGKQTASRYLVNAVVETVDSRLTGCTTRHAYRLAGGLMSTSST